MAGTSRERVANADLIGRAFEFAHKKHYGQYRKYTNEPYIEHPAAVARIILSLRNHTAEMVAAALLHDVVEDTDATIQQIYTKFGSDVGKLVQELTDISRPEDGNRRMRKLIDKAHLRSASADAQTIKVADIMHNVPSIVEHNSSFAKLYLKEKITLLNVLSKADKQLLRKARRLCNKLYKEI